VGLELRELLQEKGFPSPERKGAHQDGAELGLSVWSYGAVSSQPRSHLPIWSRPAKPDESGPERRCSDSIEFVGSRAFRYDAAMESDRLFDDHVIDLKPRRSRRLFLIAILLVLVLLLFGSELLSVYVDALWFSSLGYSQVYWYKFRMGGLLFLAFLTVSFLLVRVPFVFLNKVLPELNERPKVRVASVEDLRDINVLPILYRPGVWLLPIAVALLSAINLSQEWPSFALYLNSQKAGVLDPIFGRDVSFYIFELPVLNLVASWFQTLAFIVLAAVGFAAGYIWYVDRMRGTLTLDTRRRVVKAVSIAAAFFALALAATTYLDRFDLLESRHDLFTGVNYSDANFRLPALNVVVILLAVSAALLLFNAFRLKQLRFILWPAAIVIVVWVLGVALVPQLVFSLSVKPNELAKEAPFIGHNISMTRQAFGLDRFEERPYQPAAAIDAARLQTSLDTLDNVRLWDRRTLKSTLAQIQEIRTYYDFQAIDVDRYVINHRPRQVMLSAREMNVNQLPEKNWINQHVIYTHGYGVTMNTASEFTPEGLPNLVLKNMPVESTAPELKVTRPELYYGEATTSHVYVNTRPQASTQPEFNYPAPDNKDSYTLYQGAAGIQVGGFFRKLALSLYLGDGTNLLLSDYINAESRVLIRRQISERIQQIAPFILFEDDPYIVITRDGRLRWMIDGFTVSDRYPYSTTYQLGNRDINYIRNSVKAVVDAYDGTVEFFVFEPDDPIIKAYSRVFPQLFHPMEEMPPDLREHVRYPSLLLTVQADVYRAYHMQNTQTFYNHEDLWAIATGESAAGAEATAMEPYHVLMVLPGEPDSRLEFVSILPFTPAGVGRSNMIGWMAARSDGANYGHMLVFTFPKNVTINGPAQIRARVNQDSQISQQMTLWSQKGSELLRGNLLVIPVADSLLYVEPFYLQAEGSGSKLPELRLIALAMQDRLASGKTFADALAALFPTVPATVTSSVAQAESSTAAAPEAKPKQANAPPPPKPVESTGVDSFKKQVQQLVSDYERLTAQGKHKEAGEKLDQLKRLVESGQKQ
jgi:uncharacterized membrane protein (UPF0182 family)